MADYIIQDIQDGLETTTEVGLLLSLKPWGGTNPNWCDLVITDPRVRDGEYKEVERLLKKCPEVKSVQPVEEPVLQVAPKMTFCCEFRRVQPHRNNLEAVAKWLDDNRVMIQPLGTFVSNREGYSSVPCV